MDETRRFSALVRRQEGSLRLAAVLLAAVGLAGCGLFGSSAKTTSPPAPTSPYAPYVGRAHSAVGEAIASLHIALPTKRGAPAPALPADAFGDGLGSRDVIGFLPSWELGEAGEIDYSAVSAVCYYALQVEPHGTVLEKGAGWEGLDSASAAELVSDAHSAGARVLLTLFSETPSTLSKLAASPATSGSALARKAAYLARLHGMDGVDLDLEGNEGGDRSGFTAFVASFSKTLRSIEPSYSIVLNTLPQSAVDEAGMYDVKALSRYVDDFFVMAYDMNDPQIPGPTAPLSGETLSDSSSLASYVAVVPAKKVILGIPFYGYQYEASRRRAPAVAIGQPTALTYGEIAGSGHESYWDPDTETAYSSYRNGSHWRETFFDDPASVAVKVALAAAFKVGGVGAWELGMAVGYTNMTTALDGGSPPSRQALAAQG